MNKLLTYSRDRDYMMHLRNLHPLKDMLGKMGENGKEITELYFVSKQEFLSPEPMTHTPMVRFADGTSMSCKEYDALKTKEVSDAQRVQHGGAGEAP